jgi:hypothetical protein
MDEPVPHVPATFERMICLTWTPRSAPARQRARGGSREGERKCPARQDRVYPELRAAGH